jgi:hypothetical protein
VRGPRRKARRQLTEKHVDLVVVNLLLGLAIADRKQRIPTLAAFVLSALAVYDPKLECVREEQLQRGLEASKVGGCTAVSAATIGSGSQFISSRAEPRQVSTAVFGEELNKPSHCQRVFTGGGIRLAASKFGDVDVARLEFDSQDARVQRRAKGKVLASTEQEPAWRLRGAQSGVCTQTAPAR